MSSHFRSLSVPVLVFFILLSAFAQPGYCQSVVNPIVLTNDLAGKMIAPLVFEDRTQAVSVVQAANQFNSMTLNASQTAFPGLVSFGLQPSQYWIKISLSNPTAYSQWVLKFKPQNALQADPIKTIRFWQSDRPETPLMLDKPAQRENNNTFLLSVPSGQNTTFYAFVESWGLIDNGVQVSVMPLKGFEQIRHKNSNQALLLWAVIGVVIGSTLLQLILTRQAIYILAAFQAVLVAGVMAVLSKPFLIENTFITLHPVALHLILYGIILVTGGFILWLLGSYRDNKQTPLAIIPVVMGAVGIVTGLGFVMLTDGMSLALQHIPSLYFGFSMLTLIGAAIGIGFYYHTTLWFLPSWLVLTALPWLHALVPTGAMFLYYASLLIGNVGYLLGNWHDVDRESRNMQQHLRQELQKAKNLQQEEHLLYEKKLASERELMSNLKQKDLQRAAELDKARREAEDANKAKSDFLAIISHEIRTPMTGIMGIIQLITQTILSEKQKEYLEIIKNSGETMLTLLNDILDYSKIEKGAIEIETIPFQLRNLVQSVVTLMNGRAEEKGLHLKIDIDPDVYAMALGDPNRLRQILLNLISNALKFTEQGTVTIKVTRENAASPILRFDVIDTGIGISHEAQQKLFQPYAQADSTIARRFGGTGLGLNICRMLVEAMNGTIGVTSEPDKGSTFWFTLPLPETTEQKIVSITSIEGADYKPWRPLRVLVIDDNPINLKVVAGLLEVDGHSVYTRLDAPSGIDFLQKDTVDVVMVDIVMPEMDGLAFARAVRNFNNHVPIYALTGLNTPQEAENARLVGMQGMVSKPVTVFALRHIIDTVSKTLENSADQDSNEVDMAFKDLFNKLSGLSEENQAQMLKKLNESLGGVKKLYGAVRDEIRFGLASDNIPDDETGMTAPVTVPKKRPAAEKGALLNVAMITDLKNTLPPESFKEIFDALIPKAVELVGNIEEAFAAKDMDDVMAKAHNLKGMAGNFGLNALMQESAILEKAGQTNDSKKAAEHVPGLRHILSDTLAALDDFIKA